MQNLPASKHAVGARRYWDRRFAVCAFAAALVDLTTKQLATSMLGTREIALGDRFGLIRIWNTGVRAIRVERKGKSSHAAIRAA